MAAPGDADEACIWAGRLLNLAWKYQTPAILLIDKEISESTFTFNENVLEEIKEEDPLFWDNKGVYERYKDEDSGISPLAFPGQKNAVIKSNSYEHEESGLTTEDKEVVVNMQNKRLRKFEEMKSEVKKMEAVKVYGNKDSNKAVIAWGSTKGPAKEACDELDIKLIQPLLLEPFPSEQIKEALQGVEKVALVETTSFGQLSKVLGSYQIKVDKKVLKYDARPFLPSEIIEGLKEF